MPRRLALSLNNISVRYGSTAALDGVSLDVRRGEIVGLLGPNGSGKSTTLAVAAGILEPRSGIVAACGVVQKHDPCGYATKIGLVPQEPALYDELTAEANLAFFGRLYGLRGYELNCRVATALDRVRLIDRCHDRVGTFSGGMKQRLNLACALLHDPPLLLLDEPTAALDPKSRELLFADLDRLRQAGHAVLLTTHHLDEAEYGCDRIAVLEKGKLVAEGKPVDLIRCSPTDRAILYGQLREHVAAFFIKGLRRKLEAGVELEIVGRRLRLSAECQEQLGRSLGLLLGDGIALNTFHTPPGRLDTVRREVPVPMGEPCDAS